MHCRRTLAVAWRYLKHCVLGVGDERGDGSTVMSKLTVIRFCRQRIVTSESERMKLSKAYNADAQLINLQPHPKTQFKSFLLTPVLTANWTDSRHRDHSCCDLALAGKILQHSPPDHRQLTDPSSWFGNPQYQPCRCCSSLTY